jgi:hypothetical protein
MTVWADIFAPYRTVSPIESTNKSAKQLGRRVETRDEELLLHYKLEVIGIPVSDVDTAKSFYSDIVGFTVDHDISARPGMRVVQLTAGFGPLYRLQRSHGNGWSVQEFKH